MVDSWGWDVSLVTDGWVTCVLAIALGSLFAQNSDSMDVIVAELTVVLLAAEDVGLTIDHGDCVVGACEGEPVSKSA